MTKIEKKIISFIEKHLLDIFLLIVTVFACIIRIKNFNFYSNDFLGFLTKWLDYLKYNGNLHALASYPGDYNAPYITLLALFSYTGLPNIMIVKIISIFFDFLLAFASGKLVHEITKEKNKYFEYVTYSIILFLPTVIINSSMWGQCDSIYTSFVILSLLFLIKKKYKLSFLFLGFAFAFKLQFIFILPLYLVLYFRKKEFSIFNFLLIPLVNIILCIPAIVFGKPIKECLEIYFNQTSEYNDMLSQNAINFYNIFDGYSEYLYSFGIMLTIFICGFVLFYCIYKKIKFDNKKILYLGLWFILVVTYFLPGMHDRYVYVGEILAVILLILYKKPIVLTVWLFILALICYARFLFSVSIPIPTILSIVYLLLIVNFTIQVFAELNNISSSELRNLSLK